MSEPKKMTAEEAAAKRESAIEAMVAKVYRHGLDHLLSCPGHAITDVRHPVSELEHDKSRCCRTCDTHVTPHKGCTLR
jgi:hypothetical protein